MQNSITTLFFVFYLYSVFSTTAGRTLTSDTAFSADNGNEEEVGQRSEVICVDRSDCDKEEPPRDFKASNIAIKAAQEAKEAQEAQQIAGAQAAHQAKAQLAEKADQAAHAAEAALEGREALVLQLENEIKEAVTVFEEEMNSYRDTQANIQATLAGATQASQLLKTLSYTIQLAQNNVANAQQNAERNHKELAEKAALVDAAKSHVETLKRKLELAKQDLFATRQAAIKAEAAARNAETAAQRNRRKMHPRKQREGEQNERTPNTDQTQAARTLENQKKKE